MLFNFEIHSFLLIFFPLILYSFMFLLTPCISKIWENFKFKIKIHSFKWEQKAVTIIFSIIIFASVICWQFYPILGEKLNFPVNYRSHDDFCSILHTWSITHLRVWYAFNRQDPICGSYSMYVERTNKWIQTDQVTISYRESFSELFISSPY